MNLQEFEQLRFGMFIHYGLYSSLGRGEWVQNREHIPAEEYRKLRDSFTAENFDPDAITQLAVDAGMRYLVFTTMHHEGFRLYDSSLTDFCSTKSPCGRDLTAEIMAACRKRGLKIGLYHSLNQWSERPDGVDALESRKNYETFISNTFARIRELATRYRPFDIFWYDGWWPFHGQHWKAEEMNAMVREIEPLCLINGRNGLAGDFATPEQHLTAPDPWRPWEACVTHNNSWGFHHGDHAWKSPAEVIKLLVTCANGRGNLLFNIGPKPDGSIPEPTVRVLREVGQWLKRNGEAIFDTDFFRFRLNERVTPETLAHRSENTLRSDWNYHGPMTAKGDCFYQLIFRWLGGTITIGGVQSTVKEITELASGKAVSFRQDGPRLILSGLPDEPPDPVCAVYKIRCEGKPVLYSCGGLRIPSVSHRNYDPVESDLLEMGG